MAIARIRRACLLSKARRAAARSSTSVKSVRVTATATMPPLANRRSQHRLTFARYWESPHESGLSTLGIISLGLAFHERQPKLLRRAGARGKIPRRPGHNLLIRFRDFKADVLRFAANFKVPF